MVDLSKLVCSYMNGQHDCNHKYRFVHGGMAYEGWVDVYVRKGKGWKHVDQFRDSFYAGEYVRKQEKL